MKYAFVWHWHKRTTPELQGALATEDTLLMAIQRLSREGHEVVVFVLAKPPYNVGYTFNERQQLRYYLATDKVELLAELRNFDPDMVMLGHHQSDYSDVLQAVLQLRARKTIYFTANLSHMELISQFDGFFFHHGYLRDQLVAAGIPKDKTYVAPKTADMERFKPRPEVPKLWDCIYPSRGPFGYWKRNEMAVEACRLIGATIVLPASQVPGTLDQMPSGWQTRLHNLSPRVWNKLANRLPVIRPYPWITTLGWQLPEEMALRYNQARVMVITSDVKETGPRSIPEAAASNLPIVCCSDSPANVSFAERLGGFIADPNPQDVARKIKQALACTPNSRQLMFDVGLDTWVVYRAIREFSEKVLA